MDQLTNTTNVGAIKLEGAKNWNVWKFQVGVLMRGLGVFEIAEGAVKPEAGPERDEWLKKDSKAQSLIVTRLSETVMLHVLTCQSAAEIWRKLHIVYEQKSETSIHMVQQQFFQYKYAEDMEMSVFLSKIQEFQNKLKQLGEEIPDKLILTKILMSLPDKYSYFISAWESTASENQTLDNLMARLLIEEERQRSKNSHAEESVALLAKKQNQTALKCYKCGQPGHFKKNCKNNNNQNVKTCYYCKKPGHVISVCRFRLNKEKDKEQEKTGNAFIVTASVGNEQQLCYQWIVDSGASEHMSFERNLFNSYNELSNKNVIIGDGRKLKAVGEGQITLKVYNGHDFIQSTLNKVLYVPDLKMNLFSVTNAVNKGYVMKIDNNKCDFIKDNKVCAVATRSGKFYIMNIKYDDTVNTNAMASVGCNLKDWHERLVHQNVDRVKCILKKNNIECLDSNDTCIACVEGKQHRLPFERSEKSTSTTGELVHADVCGPMEENSIGGSRYFLLLKDDHSNYRTVYFMKRKSETVGKIKHFLKFTKSTTGNTVRTLRTDNGLEFVNSGVKSLLEDNGVIHETTVPYTPEQNGKAERDMRTIVEAARTMIQAKRLKKDMWAEAVNTTVYVLNRTSKSTVQGKTPFEVWTGKSFDIRSLQIFGTEVYVHIPKEKRKKWDPKGERGIFVGYGETTKGYRIYFPERRMVDIKRDIVFIKKENEVNGEEIEQQFEEAQENSKMEDQPEKTEERNIEIEEQGSSRNERIEEEEGESDEENETERSNSPETTTRSKRNVRKPNWLDIYETSFIASFDNEPISYEEAMKSEEAEKWKKAMKAETEALEENNTWQVVKKPKVCEVIDSKWVYKRKRDECKNVVTYKARLVARGFKQTNVSFSDIYSPVAKLPTVRVFLAICNQLQISVLQLDVCSAFLYGNIETDVYMSLPEGFNIGDGMICKLNKSLYGLKNSPKNWNNKFDELMKSQGFRRSENDYCLYVKIFKNAKTFVLLYVDDLLLAGTDQNSVEILKQVLNSNFKMKDLGSVKHYLGMEIIKDLKAGETRISQTMYLENVLSQYGMENSKPASTPMDVNFKHEFLKRDKSENEEIEHRCRKLIGSLMYAMMCTRPDLSLSISILSRYQSCASNDLWKSLKRVLRYIKGTVKLNLIYKLSNNSETCVGYVDSDWAGDTIDRKSTAGYCFQLFNNTVSWASRKQPTVAMSSTEAEYMALSLAVSEACWMRNLYNDFELQDDYLCIKIFEDNQAAIRVANNPEFHKRLKHIDIKFHFVREKIRNKIVEVKYLSTTDQIADVLTKPLGRVKLEKFRHCLGVI